MQIVGYVAGTTADFDDRDPALLVAGEDPPGDAGSHASGPGDGTRPVGRVPLDPGTILSYALGERRCAGALDGDRHHPCPRPRSPYCDRHADTWVCARCTGTCLKDEMDCHQNHAVYLAAFAPDSFKVGVTKLARLPRRLVEQGADRGAHVRTVTNGRIAREIESEIAEEIPDSVRVPTKVAGFGSDVDESAWERLLSDFAVQARIRPEYDLSLSRRPVADTLAAGTVRGVKGRVLVLERGGTTYAVDMRDLVGHELDEGEEGPELQSSLGAFG